ncbi:MAG: tRNA dihydrouridine synthase DusB [Fimbriimonadaceae bacterium]|nr:tRNA dihydrouridine synthase DusB [Fimbriimonadaceae bacterium]QYK55034.1 MAG: tRNA dihydrouridine synthase DusB [Fimbriimonadaceae bacterium]
MLAPMEDVTALPMRLIAKRVAAPGLMFSEFVSAMAIHYGAKKTLKKLRVHEEERPLGIQIFGAEPDVMAETARLCEEAGADLIDINMGCWVPKVCRTGSGAALLKDPDAAEAIVRAVVRAVAVPVTVKVRAGWDYSLFAAPELAKRFVGVGAQMITLHARFAKQGFEGEADWSLVRELRKAVEVPLLGNGDVKTADDARRMVEETGCDGVMVGRAAISNPWRLRSIRCGLTGEPAPPEPGLSERVATALDHAKLMVQYEHEADEQTSAKTSEADVELRAIRALRGQLPLYIKGAPGASDVRGRLSTVSSVAELEDILTGFLQRASAASAV